MSDIKYQTERIPRWRCRPMSRHSVDKQVLVGNPTSLHQRKTSRRMPKLSSVVLVQAAKNKERTAERVAPFARFPMRHQTLMRHIRLKKSFQIRPGGTTCHTNPLR